MTVTAPPEIADGPVPPTAARRDVAGWVSHVAMSVALVYWGFVLTHATGGRDPMVLTIAIPLALIALAAARPWRLLPAWQMALAAAVAVAALMVCLLDPPHFFGASQAATYAYSAVLFLAVRGYASTAGRRALVLMIVIAAALAQFGWASLAYLGGDDPTWRMVGTFYWWNPFAAFLLVPAVAGAGLAAIGRGPLRLPGALAAVLGSAGIVLSTSRATMALLVAGWLLAGGVAVLSRRTPATRTTTLLRWLVLAAVAWGFTLLLPGPPFFSHRVSALAGTAARGAGESLTQNSGYRVVFWRQALKVFGRHPVTGGGFGSFGHEANVVDPGGAHTALVHSGLLQPLSDGGLLLGIPFLLACALIAAGLIKRVLPRAWPADNAAVTLVAVGTLLLGVHSAVDFDWTYPSSMAATAVLAALALAWSPQKSGVAASGAGEEIASEGGARSRRTGMVACAVLAAAGLVLGQQARHGGWHLTAHVDHPASSLSEGHAR